MLKVDTDLADMTNPPRRSRSRKPDQTIDLAAERIEAAPQPDTADAPGRSETEEERLDPEAGLGDGASRGFDAGEDERSIERAESAPLSDEGMAREPDDASAAFGETVRAADGDTHVGSSSADEPVDPADIASPRHSDENAEPAGAEETPSAETAFAADESLRPERSPNGDGAQENLDAETILAAAEPHHAEPPRPDLDYHQTSLHPPEAHGPGPGAVIGAALLGAVIALLAGGTLQYAGVLPAVRPVDETQLEQQFARSGDVQQLTTDLNAVRGDVGQLQSALSAGGVGGGGPSGADFASLADRVNGIDARLNGGAANSPQSGGAAVDPNAVRAAGDAANAARDAASQAQQVAGTARETAEGARNQAAEARQTASTAQQAAQTAQQAAGVAQNAANGAREAADANRQAVADIASRIASVEAANRQAATAIAAANLKAAVDRGGPFMAELEGYAKAAGAAPTVESLRSFAAEGVPTLAVLQDEWPDRRKEMLAALRPVDPDAGVGAQIVSGLSSLVTVRPSGTAGGNGQGVDATVARLDAALRDGDLKTWNSQWQTLPQPAKDASAAFERKLRARADAEGVVGDALNAAVQAIGTTG